MPSWFARWVARRKAIRKRWQTDAASLISKDELNAYYEAQRLAARARARGDRPEFIHWLKVAAEEARLSPISEMGLSKVQYIVDDEMKRRV